MKLLLLLILGSPLFTIGQDSVEYEIMDFPDIEATFPGGVVELHKFVLDNISYPQCPIDPTEDSRIYLFFIVDSEGKAVNAKVEKAPSHRMTEIGLELISQMPDWIPAQHLGENVASHVRLPIIICLH